MTTFQRERRYAVTKLKTGKPVTCVVVEADWPEYEIVWGLIKDRVEGRKNVIEKLENYRDDALELIQKLMQERDKLKRERDKLKRALISARNAFELGMDSNALTTIGEVLSANQESAEQYKREIEARVLEEAGNFLIHKYAEKMAKKSNR